MKISLNGQQIDFNENQSLLQLLELHNFANKIGIAVAINNSVVPKSEWNNKIIKDNDSILVISATKGG